jgi:hypothetical protein
MEYLIQRSDGSYMGETLWEDQLECALVFNNPETISQIKEIIQSVNNNEKIKESWELVEKT